MTTPLFMDAYLRNAEVNVVSVNENMVVTDATLFYAQGGGQPGDTGSISWGENQARVVNSVKVDGQIAMVLDDAALVPEVGQKVRQTLDWDRRYLHMRMHTALHLLSVAIPLPVTGGAITDVKGRLDFDMPEALEDKDEVCDRLNAIIARDLAVTESWITDAKLDANPGLVKTMSVKPPTGAGRVRLVRIGANDDQVDLQPCGGTHVAQTSEIGRVRIGKIEKKGRQNRRVNLFLEQT